MTATPKLRLVKVVVQATFVTDDGEHLQEVISDRLEVPAAEWPSFALGRFEELRAQAELDIQGRGLTLS